MKSIAWMTMDNETSRPNDYKMTLASVRSEAHAFLSPTDHRQHEPRSQHRLFRTTIMRLNLYFNYHQYLPEQKFPSFCQKHQYTTTIIKIFGNYLSKTGNYLKPSQQKSPKRINNWIYPQIHLSLIQIKLMD